MTVAATADVVIVGAGHAGVHLAVALAKAEHQPTVLLIGDEPELPYERPPLTKRLLYDAPGAGPILLRSAEYWQKSPVTLRTGQAVVAVDPVAKSVTTDDGASVGYGTLVWATGGMAAPCGLPGEQLRGVHSLRDFADLTAFRTDLAGAAAGVVVGGGYLGLEAAAGLRQLGIAVTVVELASRLLARVTGSVTSQFFTALHRSHGTDVRLGQGVERFVGRAGRVAAVRLTDGTEQAADVVLVAVGMRPNVAPLLAVGVRGDASGIEVDTDCRTSLPDVYAIGDCAKQLNPWSATGAIMRVESVHNASQHATAVLHAICGLPAVDPAPPRFWSTQYGHELKTVGLASPDDEQVLRGDLSGSQFSVVYLRDGRMVAIDAVNRPRDFARAQSLIAQSWRPVDRDRLVDGDVELPRLSAVAGPVEVGA